MRQLDPDDMKIEHYLSQKDHPGARLRWPNLLGACRGNEQDTGSKLRHCDASRGHATLTVDPRSPAAIAAIEYGASGAIGSRIDAHRSDLQDTLNLNCAQLREARAAALSGFVEARRRRTAQGTWTAAMLARDLERWRGAGTTLPAFAGYIECWVARRRK